MTDLAFSESLGSDAYDQGCEATFEALDQYVEMVLRGEDVIATYAHLITHVRNCAACGEDTEGLLAALQEIDPPQRTRAQCGRFFDREGNEE